MTRFFKIFSVLLIVSGAGLSTPARAETEVLSGLTQLLAQGFNLEVVQKFDRLVLDYSHGYHLVVTDQVSTSDEKKAGLKFLVRNSTGGGIGIRWLDAFHTNFEVKRHFWEIERAGFARQKYHTTTVGVGTYYTWKPFKDAGFIVVPALRYWPTVSDSLSNGEVRYADGVVSKAKHMGLAGITGLSANVKLGWSF